MCIGKRTPSDVGRVSAGTFINGIKDRMEIRVEEDPTATLIMKQKFMSVWIQRGHFEAILP